MGVLIQSYYLVPTLRAVTRTRLLRPMVEPFRDSILGRRRVAKAVLCALPFFPPAAYRRWVGVASQPAA